MVGEDIEVTPLEGEMFAGFRIIHPRVGSFGTLLAVCLLAGGSASADPARADAGTMPRPEAPVPVRFDAPDPAPPTDIGVAGDLDVQGTGLVWRHQPVAYDARERLSEALRGNLAPGLLQRYRQILMEETIRKQRRNPELFWADPFETELGHEPGLDSLRRSAERIFDSAHGEVLSQMFDHVVERSETLSALNARLRGIDLGFQTRESEAATEAGASPSRRQADPLKVNMIVSNRPRVEIKTRLPGGVKASILVPLASPGVHARLSRQFVPGMSGSLRAGVEDLGRDVWISADLRFSF